MIRIVFDQTKRVGLYTVALYLLTVSFGVYLSHGQEMRNRSCAEYLRICEASCTLRGELFRFDCLGPGINPGSDRYRCLCSDEAFRAIPRKEAVQGELANRTRREREEQNREQHKENEQ